MCPITFLAIVNKNELTGLDSRFSELKGANYELSDFSETKAILYSKDTDTLPISRTILELDTPCTDSSVYQIPDYTYFYQLEVEVDEYADCTEIDDRYMELDI